GVCPKSLLPGEVKLGNVRSPVRAVVAAAEAQPIGHLPITQNLIGVAGAGGAVVRNTAAQVQVELLDRRNVGKDRHEEFAVDFPHVEEALGVAARIDAESLILERTSLRRQRVVGELEIKFTIAVTEGGPQFAGRKVEELALDVSFHDRLARVGTVLQIRAD